MNKLIKPKSNRKCECQHKKRQTIPTNLNCEMCTITTVNSRFPQVNFVDIEYFSAKLFKIPFMSKLFKSKTYKSLN